MRTVSNSRLINQGLIFAKRVSFRDSFVLHYYCNTIFLLHARLAFREEEALGLSEDDINRAKKVKTPLLALRYQTDHLCPKERMKTLREIFQLRVAMIEIDGESQGHSTLADHFDDRAFMDSVNFLKVRLGLERSAKRMNLAKLGDRACEITAGGHWRAL